jgi:O-antigen/teichoic acid export membrane protein
MSSASTTIKSMVYSSANIYTEFLLGLVVSIIIARSLGPDTYGTYAYVIWVVALGITLVNAGISVGAIKFFSELKGSGDTARIYPLHKYFSRIQITKTLVFCAAFAGFMLLAPDLVGPEDTVHLLWVVIPAVALKSYHMYQISFFKGVLEFRYLATTALMVAPLNLALVIAAYFWYPTLTGYLSVFLITSAAFWLASTVARKSIINADVIRESADIELDAKLKKRLAMHLRTVSVSVILSFIVFRESEIYFLKQFASTADIAVFSIGFALTQAAMSLVPGVYNNLLLSKISYDVADASRSEASSVIASTHHMLLLSCLVGVPLAVFAEEVVSFLYGSGFEAATLVIQVLCISSIVSNLCYASVAYLMSVDKQPFILKLMIGAVVATLILDYSLIVRFGLNGAILAYFTVQSTVAIITAFYTFSVLGKWPSSAKVAKLAAASLMSAASGLLYKSLIDFPYSFFPGGILCVAVFAALLFAFDYFEREDYHLLGALLPNKEVFLIKAMKHWLAKRAA